MSDEQQSTQTATELRARRVEFASSETLADTLHSAPTLPDTNPPVAAARPRVQPLPPVSRRRRSLISPLLTWSLAMSALLLIVSGIGLLIYSSSTQYGSSLKRFALARTQATKDIIVSATAQQQATVHVLSTAQANIEATATAEDTTDVQATATVDNATATVTAFNDLYTQATSQKPELEDDLNEHSDKTKWDEGYTSATKTGCRYKDNTYLVSEGIQGYLQPCIARATSVSNFTYQAEIMLKQGALNQVGLLFRVNSTNTSYYFFHVSSNGTYTLDLYTNQGKTKTLSSGLSEAIVSGVGQSNQLTVIAKDDTFYLYVNNQFLGLANDDALQSGHIGIAVLNSNTPVEAAFSNVQVWKA